MKNARTLLIVSSIGTVVGPTLIWFFCQILYGYISVEEFVHTLIPLKIWMIYILVYGSAIYIIMNKLLNKIEQGQKEHREPAYLEKLIERIIIFLLVEIVLFCIIGPSTYILPENFYTSQEFLLTDILAFAFIFQFAVPFFIVSVMELDRLTTKIPLPKKSPLLSVRTKLTLAILSTTFGTVTVLIVLNVSLKLSKFEADQQLSTIIGKNLIIGFLCILAGLINIFMITRQLTDPIKKIKNALSKISTGDADLTKRLQTNSRDELGLIVSDFNTFISTIQSMILQVMEQTNEVSAYTTEVKNINLSVHQSSSEVVHAISEVSSGAISQAEDLSHSNQYLMEFGHELDRTSGYIQNVAKKSESAATIANQDSSKLKELLTSIYNIRDSFHTVDQSVEELHTKIGQINEFTDLINHISEETNLLSLNAAIEAVRAKEAGKGFTVVAEEIRKLAQQSKQSADDISLLVSSILDNSKQVIHTTKEVNKNLTDQIQIVQSTADSFHHLIDEVNSIKPDMAQALTMMDSAGTKKEKVVTELEGISSVSQETSAASEEINATAESMFGQLNQASKAFESLEILTKELHETVNRFKVN